MRCWLVDLKTPINLHVNAGDCVALHVLGLLQQHRLWTKCCTSTDVFRTPPQCANSRHQAWGRNYIGGKRWEKTYTPPKIQHGSSQEVFSKMIILLVAGSYLSWRECIQIILLPFPFPVESALSSRSNKSLLPHYIFPKNPRLDPPMEGFSWTSMKRRGVKSPQNDAIFQGFLDS